MMIRLLISCLSFQVLLVQTFPQEPLKCKSSRSKICLLQVVTAEGSEVPQFPDLVEKHTILIRSGNVPQFTEKITSQFGGVTKVTLGRLNIESLHIPDHWVTLNAESNQIRELIVDKSNDCSPEDGYQGDAPDVSVDNFDGASGTESSVVVNADDEDLKPEIPGDSKKGEEEEFATAKPEDVEDSKVGVEETLKSEKPEHVKEGTNDGKSSDSKEGAKAESRLEKLENPKDGIKEGVEGVKQEDKDEKPVDTKEGAKAETRLEQPERSKEGVEETPNSGKTENVKKGTKDEKTADFKEGAKAESRLEKLEDSKEGVKEGDKDEKPVDLKEGAKAETRLEQQDDSKEGVKETPNPEKTKNVKEGTKDEKTADSKVGAKAESRLEKPEDSKEGVKEGVKGVKEGAKDEKTADSKKDDKDQYKPQSPTDSKDTTSNAKKSTEDTIGTQPSPTNSPVIPEKSAPPEPLVGYQLRSLNLANNKLRSIKQLKCMVHLQELRLDGNELEFIEMATFVGMTKLKKLSLAKNKISHLTSPQPMELPSLEWFSLASNRLTTLQIINWHMAQLVELDVSHNMLVKLDEKNFKQFVSLERLALANNSWSCYWLNGALKEIGKHDFITLIDRNDDAGDCPNGLPVEGICCSSTLHEDDDSTNANLHDRIQRFQKEQASMDSELKDKIGSFREEWNDKWKTLNQDVAERRKRLDAKEKEPQDDTKVTDKDIRELHELIDECTGLLKDMENLRGQTALVAQSFTESSYTTMDLKNKLLAAMRDAVKLKNDLHQYEMSFKAEVK